MIVAYNPNRIINTSSKAASTPAESIIEGVPHYTVNKIKVISDFLASNGKVMDTGTNTVSKAGSAPGINKLQEILRFQMSNGRL